jgi:transcriptional regulator with XRE-family HTH domain
MSTPTTVDQPVATAIPLAITVAPARHFDGAALALVLSSARRRLGLSRSEAARRTGFPVSVVTRIESGAIMAPGFDSIARLAYLYEASLDAVAARLGLPTLRVQLDPPVELTVRDPRLRAVLLALASSTDEAWRDRTIALFTLLIAESPERTATQ